jgi:hypothetical protein
LAGKPSVRAVKYALSVVEIRLSHSLASHHSERVYRFPRSLSSPWVFLTLCQAVDYTNKFDTCRLSGLTVALCLREETGRIGDPCGAAELKGDCFAKAHISTAETPPRKDARIPRAHEDGRWPQSSGGTPQEGTPSPHALVVPGAWSFRARRDWCGAASSMPCIALASAGPVPTSSFFFGPINCR